MKNVWVCLIFIATVISACKKNSGGDPGPAPNPPTPIPTPVDPAVAGTIGFFLDNWEPRSFVTPSYEEVPAPVGEPGAFITIDAASIITKIPLSIFGQNANIWMTQMVTEGSLMNHLTKLQPHIIRFPGGSLSDKYFWNADPDQPPADAPAVLLNANGQEEPAGYWYGKNNASWTLSVNNYYNMLQQTGNTGMITINYGYARYGTGADPVAQAAHMAANWVRFDNGRTKYWEIGNESNGTWEAGYRIDKNNNKDFQPEFITGALYGKHFRVFSDSMKKAAQEINRQIYIGAYLLEKQPEGWQTQTDHTWNAGVLGESNNKADFYIIHSYYTPYQQNSTASVILNTGSENTTAMMGFVKTAITNAGAAMKPIALTEWNITSMGSRQQVSFINGMHAAILLGESLKNKYGETSRWDLANAWENGNDHGLFNIGDEPGGVSKWNPRPAFYYMYYFRKMIGDRLLSTSVIGADIMAYASSFSSGHKGVILVNKSTSSKVASIILQNATAGNRFYFYTLTGGTDNGEFSGKVYVNGRGPAEPSGGPANEYATLKPRSSTTQNGIRVSLPARSVVYMVMD